MPGRTEEYQEICWIMETNLQIEIWLQNISKEKHSPYSGTNYNYMHTHPHAHMHMCTHMHTCNHRTSVSSICVSRNRHVPLLYWMTIWNDYHPHIPFLEQLYLLGLRGEWARAQHHPDVHYSGREQLYNHQDENQGLTAFGFDLERDMNIKLIFCCWYKNQLTTFFTTGIKTKIFKLLVNISNVGYGYDNHEDYCFLECGTYLLTFWRDRLLTPKIEAVHSFILHSTSDVLPDYSVSHPSIWLSSWSLL